MYIGAFVLSFNAALFFAHPDIMTALFDMICTFQTFRAIGMMGGDALPPRVLGFYQLDHNLHRP